MIEQNHNKETEAFCKEMADLIQKHSDIPAIFLTAILSQFVGTIGAYAVLEGYFAGDVIETIKVNSNKSFNEQAETLKASSDNTCNCPKCLALKAKNIN